MKIEIFDVGHGGCSVITCPNRARMMVDCGFRLDPTWFPSSAFRGKWIDLLVLSNLDEDHVEDVPYVFRHVPLGSIFSNPTVTAEALAAMKRKHGMAKGMRTAHAILRRYGAGLRCQQLVRADVRRPAVRAAGTCDIQVGREEKKAP